MVALKRKRLLIGLIAGLFFITGIYFVKDLVFAMGLDLETMFYTLLNGAFLIIGVYIGEKITLDGLENRLRQWTAESKRLQQFFEIMDKVSKILDNPETEKNIDNLLNSATEFFEAGKELVASSEAKNFFKNATELVKQFSEKEPPQLQLPDKPKS